MSFLAEHLPEKEQLGLVYQSRNLGMEIDEIEGLLIGFGRGGIEFSLDETQKPCKRVNFGF